MNTRTIRIVRSSIMFSFVDVCDTFQTEPYIVCVCVCVEVGVVDFCFGAFFGPHLYVAQYTNSFLLAWCTGLCVYDFVCVCVYMCVLHRGQ